MSLFLSAQPHRRPVNDSDLFKRGCGAKGIWWNFFDRTKESLIGSVWHLDRDSLSPHAYLSSLCVAFTLEKFIGGRWLGYESSKPRKTSFIAYHRWLVRALGLRFSEMPSFRWKSLALFALWRRQRPCLIYRSSPRVQILALFDSLSFVFSCKFLLTRITLDKRNMKICSSRLSTTFFNKFRLFSSWNSA